MGAGLPRVPLGDTGSTLLWARWRTSQELSLVQNSGEPNTYKTSLHGIIQKFFRNKIRGSRIRDTDNQGYFLRPHVATAAGPVRSPRPRKGRLTCTDQPVLCGRRTSHRFLLSSLRVTAGVWEGGRACGSLLATLTLRDVLPLAKHPPP